MITPEMRHCAPYEVVSLQVTGTNWTSYRAIGHAYKTVSGIWKLNFHISGSVSVGVSSLTLYIVDVVFKHYEALSVSAASASGGYAMHGSTNIGAGSINLGLNASSITSWCVSGDVELDRKPNWIQES